MIKFKVLRWKNFLSTGEMMNEIRFDTHKTTLVTGSNGAGKSTMLDALCFALFKKPFRNDITLPQLVNSINGRSLEVEVEFTANGKDYLVRRGIKPNFLEIYQDGVMLNQEAHVKDDQSVLEKQILGMTYKAFTQINVLGSARFKPFMELSAAERRSVIEDLLDIQIFSSMSVLAKKQLADCKKEIDTIKQQGLDISSQIKYVEGVIEDLKKTDEDALKESRRKSYEEANKRIEALKIKGKDYFEKRQKLDPVDVRGIQEDVSTFEQEFYSRSGKIQQLKEHLSFLTHRDKCPTCKQQIHEDFRKSSVEDITKHIEEVEKYAKEALDRYNKAEKELLEAKKVNEQHREMGDTLIRIKEEIDSIGKQVEILESSLKVSKSNDDMIHKNEQKLDELVKQRDSLIHDVEKLLKDRKVFETTVDMLKDTGIKAMLIKQYIPVINKLIGEYLEKMEFFVKFTINENFEETIKSRLLNNFSYGNFSQGEKMRIDLALLFTWREIAKVRNSVSSNLLIMDEVMDSSLDAVGVDEFKKLINSLAQTNNVLIITHNNNAMSDQFDRYVKFEKVGNFSEMTVS